MPFRKWATKPCSAKRAQHQGKENVRDSCIRIIFLSPCSFLFFSRLLFASPHTWDPCKVSKAQSGLQICWAQSAVLVTNASASHRNAGLLSRGETPGTALRKGTKYNCKTEPVRCIRLPSFSLRYRYWTSNHICQKQSFSIKLYANIFSLENVFTFRWLALI